MTSQSSSSKTRSFYTIETKKKACELYEKIGNYTKVAQIVGVDRSMISKWVKVKDQLNKVNESKKRIKGGGRKASFPELEHGIYDWLCELRLKNKNVNFQVIKVKAMQLFKEFYPDLDPFKASSTWLKNFSNRYNLSLKSYGKTRTLNIKSKQLIENQNEKLIEYLVNMHGFINEIMVQFIQNEIKNENKDYEEMFDFENLHILKDNGDI